MLKFALKNMLVKRGRMALVALSIIISACVGLLSYNVSAQINDGIQSGAIYYDMIIGPSGSSTQLAMNTMFFTDKPLGTIPYSYVEELRASGLTNRVVPFTMGDSYNSARIVGTTPEFLEGKALRTGSMFETEFEAVIGSKVAEKYSLKVGDKLITNHGLTSSGSEHAASPLTVTGILKTTHTNYDNTVFTSYTTVWAIHSHEHGEDEEEEHSEASAEAVSDSAAAAAGAMSHGASHHAEEEEEEDEESEAHEGEVCAILVKSTSIAAYSKLTGAYSENANLLVINPSTVLREVLNQVDTSTRIVYILCVIILIMNILVITVITLLNLYDSKKEIALMRMIGISMKHVGQVYLIQNGILGAVSTVLALILSHVSLILINGFTASMGIVMTPGKVYIAEIAIAVTVFAISVLPTMISVLSMSKRNVLEV